MTTTEVNATLSAFGAPPRPVIATVVHRSPGERMLRVAAAVGACWGLALAAVFIPITHFVLVPALVVTGIITGVSRAREEWAIVGIRGDCPRCEWAEGFRVNGRLTRERDVSCPRCHTNLHLVTEADW